MQLPVDFFEFQNLPDEEIAVTVRNLSIGNVNHIVINVKVQLQQNNAIKSSQNRCLIFKIGIRSSCILCNVIAVFKVYKFPILNLGRRVSS